MLAFKGHMFSPLELALIVVFGAGLGFSVLRLMRRSMQRATENSPPQSLRTAKQRTLHWASMLCLLPPFIYVLGIDGTHFFPVIAVFFSQTAIMMLLRSVRVGYARRLALLPLVGIASVAMGAVVSSWPAVQSESLAAAPWVLLCVSAAFVTISGALSVFSFPIGFGERAL